MGKEERNTYTIQEEEIGQVQIADEVGKNIMEVSSRVQEKVKAAIENMTGLSVADVNIKVAGVDDDTEN